MCMNDISPDIFEYEYLKDVVATVARQLQLQTGSLLERLQC